MIGGKVVLDLTDVERDRGGILTMAAIDVVRWRVVEVVEYGLPAGAPIVIKVGDLDAKAIQFNPGLWRSLATHFHQVTVEGSIHVTTGWVRALRDLAEEAAA